MCNVRVRPGENDDRYRSVTKEPGDWETYGVRIAQHDRLKVDMSSAKLATLNRYSLVLLVYDRGDVRYICLA